MLTQKEKQLVTDKLEAITTWTPDEFEKELLTWTDEDVTRLWTILEGSFNHLVEYYQYTTPCQRETQPGKKWLRQIRRLAVLKIHATNRVKK